MNKKIPMRSCVVSHEKLPKKDLIRVVNSSDGVVIDKSSHINGHGAYIKRDNAILDKAIRTKALEKALGTTISDSVYEELRNVINNK